MIYPGLEPEKFSDEELFVRMSKCFKILNSGASEEMKESATILLAQLDDEKQRRLRQMSEKERHKKGSKESNEINFDWDDSNEFKH